MPTYKLCYFNARGLGEMLRLLFVQADVEYEDVRYSSEEWPKYKPTMLFGQMPVLFVDGEQIAHSRAALRYLAREFKLDGGNSLNAAKVDMWTEAMIEAIMKLPFYEQDEAKKAELTAVAFKDHIHPKLTKFEEAVNAKCGTYLFGNDISAADIMVFAIFDLVNRRNPDEKILDKHPTLAKVVAAVQEQPRIAKWLKERPETEN
ncbi:glutathione S-transferase 1-like [Clavelina lepadiformis]|uniref:glutathione S-transferase 1-like n=1 Tax=Clavelina lepadiformis TaxID=159417 RepID=UPI0040431934